MKNLCCPNCGNQDIHSTLKTENLKKSEHIYTHWHCKDCETVFASPHDIAVAIHDVEWESKKVFKTIILICAATLFFAASMLFSVLLKDSIVGIIIPIAMISAAIIGIIVGTLTRTVSTRTIKTMENDLEETAAKMQAYHCARGVQ